MRFVAVLATSGALLSFGLVQLANGQDTTPQAAPKTTAKAKLTNARTYKVDEQDQYKMSIKFSGPSNGSAVATLIEKVTKVYPNGDADFEEKVSDVTSEGEIPPTPTEPRTMKVDPYGIYQGETLNTPLSWGTMACILPQISDFLSDQTWPIERSLLGMGDAKISGVAKVTDQAWPMPEVGMEGKLSAGPMSGTIKGSVVWNGKASRYDKGQFTITFQDPNGGNAFMTLTISFERVAPKPASK
jgi:hypothetical protein